MAIDHSIALGVKPLQIESPVNQLAQVMQLQGAQQANQLNSLKMDEYNRGVQRQNSLRSLMGGLSPTATDEQRVTALRGASYFDEADKLETGILTRKKTGAELDKSAAETKAKELESSLKRLDVAGQTFGFVLKNPSLENAHAALDYLGTNGIYTPEQVAQYKQQTASNPASIPQLAETAFRSVLSAKDQLGKVDTVNAGDKQVTNSFDPVTGKVTQLNSQVIGQSADNKATNARTAADNAASRAIQIRGQNMTDARAKEANQSGKAPAGYRWSADGKTLEAIPGGPAEKGNQATEGERKAATLLQRLEFSSKQLDAARKANPGATTPNVLSNGLKAIGADALANAAQSPERQRIEGAQLDLLDAALTLGTGAAYTREQLEGYAKSYFPQVNDDDQTVKDKNARLKNVIDAAKIAAGRAGKGVNAGGATGEFDSPKPSTPQDAQALEWARANPADKRSADILKRLGVK